MSNETKPACRLKADALGHPAGTPLYRLMKYDYGLAHDEMRAWNKPCTSWSLTPDGGYPFISVPDDMTEVPDDQ